MSFREIADELGCTPQAVHIVYTRAIEKLRNSARMKELRRLATGKEQTG